MRLTVGDESPTFALDDLRGEHVDIKAWLAGGKPAWVGFFRFASCPLCNLRVHKMIAEWPRFKERCNYVAVFQSPPERFEGFLTKNNPPFPVIADPKMELFQAFRVEKSVGAALKLGVVTGMIESTRAGISPGIIAHKDGAAFRVPADFIIGTDGKLQLAFYGTNVAESVPFEMANAVLPGDEPTRQLS